MFFSIYLLFGQNNSRDSFDEILENLTISTIKQLNDTTGLAKIESIFDNYKTDSIKMNVLNKKMIQNDYAIGKIYALINLGAINKKINNYEQSIYYYKQAENNLSDVTDQNIKARIYKELGASYYNLKLMGQSVSYFEKVKILYSTATKPTKNLEILTSTAYKNLGEIFSFLEQYELAIPELENAVELNKKNGHILLQAINIQLIGEAYENLEALNKALVFYHNAENIYKNIFKSELGLAIISNKIGQVYIKQQKYDLALTRLQDALKRGEQSNTKSHIASTYINLGELHLIEKNNKQAKTNLVKGIEITEKTLNSDVNMAFLKVKGLKLLSRIASQEEKYKEALSLFHKATKLDSVLTKSKDISYLNGLFVKYEFHAANDKIANLLQENEFNKLKTEDAKAISTLAILLAVIAVLLITVFLFIFHRQQQSNQEKKIMTLEQNMLKSQMNPHFIFNSLNSIKQYVISNEKENAVYFLNKFAKLIRKILITSNEKDISLADELETMTHYMTIENMRFANEIDFTVNVDKDLKPESIRVPSLILQPFLENALWHGLSSKKTDKKVKLDINKKKDHFITIEITDNGVGRKVSEERKIKETMKRKSVGIEITKERLLTFAKRYGSIYDLTIIDLFNSQDKACGTKVVLTIPI